MNNYCRNCGEKITSNICQKCGAEVIEKRINIEEKKKEIDEFKKLEKKYILIIILIPVIVSLINTILLNFRMNFFQPFIPISYLVDIIFAIYVRIKMASSKLIRILFIIGIIFLIIYALGMIFLMLICNSLMRG